MTHFLFSATYYRDISACEVVAEDEDLLHFTGNSEPKKSIIKDDKFINKWFSCNNAQRTYIDMDIYPYQSI